MKWEPLLAMVLLVLLGMWLVLQPAVARGRSEVSLRVGAEVISATRHSAEGGASMWRFTAPADLAALGAVDGEAFARIVGERIDSWRTRPAWERKLLGFFNISQWGNFVWVALGLAGQGAFFGRMLLQWVVSEKSGRSQVPELFWWFSFAGGVCLFAYFVWRVDIVGVLGQSAGVVIYARNLRLISKQKQRDGRTQADPAEDPAPAPGAVEAPGPGAP